MKFAPKKESELSTFTLIPAGIYDCEVMEAEDKISTAGNEMIKVKLGVFDAQGKKHVIFDYLMEKIAYKLRHAAYAFGQGDAYDKGTLEAIDLQGQAAKVKIKIDPAKDGYDAKNVVVDYIVPDKVDEKTVKSTPKDLDDSIPF